MSRVLLLSGPNLNLLGEREPAIYGTATLDDLVKRAEVAAAAADLELRHLQSNHEGELIDAVHAARGNTDALIINAGALSHTRGRCTMPSPPSTAPSLSCTSRTPPPASRSGTRRSWRRSQVASSPGSVGSGTN